METDLNMPENMKIPRDNKSLWELKDYGILLRLGGEYLCEQPVLEKLGLDLEKTAESLRDYVEQLKGKFVGKPVEEIDFSEPLERIKEVAEGLKDPDEQIEEKCKTGQLGIVLSETRTTLRNRIDEFADKIEGKSVSYKKTDSLYQHLERVKYLFLSLIRTYKILSRVIACVGVACFITFVVLLATMQTEKELLVKVGRTKAEIQTKQATLHNLGERMKSIQEQIKALELGQEGELTREQKIKIMELNLATHKLSEKMEKLQFEIEMYRKQLQKEKKEIIELKNKSILQRLLRL